MNIGDNQIGGNIAISGGLVFDGNTVSHKDLYIERGLFVEKPSLDDSEYLFIDAEGGLVTPGFIDTHIHGAFGFDTSDASADGLGIMAQRLPEYGVVAFCPTTMSLKKDRLIEVLSSVEESLDANKSNDSLARILGVHLEGPMLNRSKAAAQDVDAFLDLESGNKLLEEIEGYFPNLVKIVSFAPEISGREDFVRRNSQKYSLSLAHTEADYCCAISAFNEGANSVTHVLNAMEEISKRAPGVPAAAFDKNVYVEIICDGKHIEEPVLRMLFSLFDENKLVIVSDSMRGAGMPDGKYLLGTIDVDVKDNRTYFGPNGNLAGSVSNLSEEYKVLCDAGIDRIKILKALTVNPLKRMGIEPKELGIGYILPGYSGSFNLFNSDNVLVKSAINGHIISKVRM